MFENSSVCLLQRALNIVISPEPVPSHRSHLKALHHIYTYLKVKNRLPCTMLYCLIAFCISLLSLAARLLPEAEAERRGRAGGKRESGWRTVTQAEGPQQTPFPQGTRHSGTNASLPAPQQHSGTAETAPHDRTLKQALFSALDLSHATPRPLTPKSQHCHTHLAFLHCCDIWALFVYVFHCPHCRTFTALWALVFEATGRSSGDFFWPFENKKNRASSDWSVPRILGHNLPLRQVLANHSSVSSWCIFI